MKVRTVTEKFEASHGKKPSGRGTWFFEVTMHRSNGSFATEVMSATGTMSEARKSVVETVKSTVGSVESVTVTVMP